MDETHGYGKGHIISGTCFNPCAPLGHFCPFYFIFIFIILPVLMLTA